MSNLSGHGQLTGIMRTGGGGGGGSEVIINPSGVAIGTMEKISVDGDIYEVRNVPETTGAEFDSVLTHTENGENWIPVPKELPSITSLDEGKVLGISNGNPAWISSGGGSSEMTLLYEAQTPLSTGIVTLENNISNYDLLCFRIVFNVPTYFDVLISTQLIEDIGYIEIPSSSGKHFTILTYNNGYIRTVRGINDNILNFFEQTGSCYISKIYGIKY